MKKILAMFLAAAMTLSMAACGGSGGSGGSSTPAPAAGGESGGTEAPAAEGDNGEGAEIAMITDVGTIDDKAFNQGTWEGVKMYAEEKGISHKYYKPAEKSDDAYYSAIDLAVKGGAKVVVTPGYLFEPAIFKAQTTYPDVNFILLDGYPNNGEEGGDYVEKTEANAVGIKYAEEQSGFLAGYAAVKEGYTKLGFMGGMAVPAVVKFGYGFVQGADVAAKEMGVEGVEINYHYTGGFEATPEAQTLAATWFQNGIEVVFACGGPVGNSVMAAAAASTPTGKVIGVDVDQSSESDTVITSAMKALSQSVYDTLDAYYNGSFPGGQNEVLDAADNGVQLPMETSRFEKFTQADYDAIYKQLADGTVKPVKDVDDSGESIAVMDLPVTNVKITEVN